MSGTAELSRADKVARAKLVADFQSVLKEFERASARAAAAAQSYAPREEPAMATARAEAGEGDPLLSAAREAAEVRSSVMSPVCLLSAQSTALGAPFAYI